MHVVWAGRTPDFSAWMRRHPGAHPGLAHTSREGDIWYLGDASWPRFVLKRWAPDSGVRPGDIMEFLACAASRGLPVPKPAGWGVDETLRPVLAMRYVGVAETHVGPRRAEELGALLVRLHRAEPWYFDGVVPIEGGAIRRVRLALQDHTDLLAQAPGPEAVRPGPSCLVHGDFHAGNVMIAGRRLTVIDWTDVRLGDPLWDLAWAGTLLWIYQGPEAYRHFVASYRSHSMLGSDEASLRAMELLAGLRWLFLARTAPVPINQEWLQAADQWIGARARTRSR